MLSASAALALVAMLPTALGQTLTNETVLGVYIFHRHGDRTAKMTPPANLTYLGYQEVHTSGQYYRDRYIASDAPYQINGINTDIVKQSQISVSSPSDAVLDSSAMGFLQGLYPPVGSGLDTQTLKNGTVITAPLQGYQLIPISPVSSGSNVENSGWLQAATGCQKATLSSNNYFVSDEYSNLLKSTQGFYDELTPVINNTFNQSQISFKNAYTIFDLINVAEIHNVTFDPNHVVTNESFYQLRTLADAHEWGLAYNASDNMRAVAGMTLAAQVVQSLNETIAGKGKQKFNIQFGAYGTFASFFGLAIPDINTVDPNLRGVADYASSMAFEMYTNSSTEMSSSSYPSTDDIYVRMVFHNGTASNLSEPRAYPLFGSGQPALKWNDFTKGMNAFSIGSTEQWCTACGNTTGTCASYSPRSSSGSESSSPSAKYKGNGLSPAVNGVIGAMVTLVVVFGVEALIMILAGLRLVRKNWPTAENENITAAKA